MDNKLKLLNIFSRHELFVTNQDGSYTFTYTNNSGTGKIRCYEVFDGIILCYNNFEMYDCYCAEQKKIDGIFEINHCKVGRYECQFSNGKYGYMEEGDLSVNSLGNTVQISSFPLEYYEGISVIIDTQRAGKAIEKEIPCIKINIGEVMSKLCKKNECFIARASERIEHVLSELYNIPEKVKDSYMKIKIIELLLFLTSVDIKDQKSSSRYLPQKKVEKIKDIREKLVDNLGERYTIEQLSEEFKISSTALKSYFKGVYGCSVYSYIRNYRMKKAAFYLAKTDYTITEIATLLGYTNSSKFSAAFKDIINMTPTQYKKKATE